MTPKMYNKTEEELEEITKYTREYGFQNAHEKFGVARSTIQRWVKQYEKNKKIADVDNKNRIVDKMIDETRLVGGIGLKHQKIKLTEQDALIKLNRVYVDDEVLNANRNYTVILIPEGNKTDYEPPRYYIGKEKLKHSDILKEIKIQQERDKSGLLKPKEEDLLEDKEYKKKRMKMIAKEGKK
ncbi:MAG: hypothetical protein GY870_05200 [archaeon]|nr:hypothetical protein [archaeon]